MWWFCTGAVVGLVADFGADGPELVGYFGGFGGGEFGEFGAVAQVCAGFAVTDAVGFGDDAEHFEGGAAYFHNLDRHFA